MDDLLKDFLAESAENLARLDHDVVELERDPSNTELLNSIFRAIHTIKGTCGFLGLTRLECLSHTAESVLELLRAGSLRAEPDVISDILRAVDVVKSILAGLEATQAEPVGDDSFVIGVLETWLTPEPGATSNAAARNVSSTPASTTTTSLRESTSVSAGDEDAIRELGVVAAAQEPVASLASTSLRVNVSVLDALMNLAGELVLTRNQLIQMSCKDEDSAYTAPVQQLSRITAELQNAVMKTRMQPVGSAWSKLPRIVRDVARDTGKKIELDMKGADTELDRQLVQALQDPLTHMVRNSADHGIERPDARRAAGKSDVGKILLKASHEGGHVTVDIVDDGAGIDPARVRAKAVERGLVRRDAAESMTDDQILRFVFEPGFSTAEVVTHLSGRGVGMDVVRSNIEKVGGTVELQSTRGHGCTIRIRLPLTLAIVPSLLVSVGGEWFAFPQTSVLELVHITDNRSRFDELHGVPLFRLRDTLMPVVSLAKLFQLDANEVPNTSTIVVCQVGSSRFGVIVDEVVDTQEIVVKPVGRKLRPTGCYAGCTILGDGRVIMIVDPAGLAMIAGMRSTEARSVDPEVEAVPALPLDSLLLFDGGSESLQAVPLSEVARLEEIPSERIEIADGRYLVQYRGSLLPLVAASPSVSMTAGLTRSVIVFNDGTSSFGMAVNEIRDIVQDRLDIELGRGRPGILGTAVIAGAATEVLDVAYFMARSRGGDVS